MSEPRIRVSALLEWRDRILLCRHEKPGKEYWLLPGGGVDAGESLTDALHRELAELYALGAPIEERVDAPEGVLVRARLPRRELRRFAPYLVAEARAEQASTSA